MASIFSKIIDKIVRKEPEVTAVSVEKAKPIEEEKIDPFVEMQKRQEKLYQKLSAMPEEEKLKLLSAIDGAKSIFHPESISSRKSSSSYNGTGRAQ
jgi:hypothetical protein